MATTSPPRSRPRRAASRVRRLVLGDDRRLGLWVLPLFLLVGLLGATLAGGLAVLYYAQQVRDLERTTAEARAQLDQAVGEVERTAEQARAAIDEQVARVRESLAQGLPIASPNDAGIYAVAARHPGGEVRVGSAFVVYSDARDTYLVTSYRVVALDGGRALAGASVFLPQQTVDVSVFNYDPALDLAVVVLRGGPLPVPGWRPLDAPLFRGDALYLAGVAGPDAPAVLEGRAGVVHPRAVATTAPVSQALAGGPLLDVEGRVVAVASVDYAPFGQGAGGLRYAVPVRLLCERLIQCTEADVGAAEGQSGAGVPVPVPTERAPAATPEPAPRAATPEPSPSPRTPTDREEEPGEEPGPQAPRQEPSASPSPEEDRTGEEAG